MRRSAHFCVRIFLVDAGADGWATPGFSCDGGAFGDLKGNPSSRRGAQRLNKTPALQFPLDGLICSRRYVVDDDATEGPRQRPPTQFRHILLTMPVLPGAR